MIRSAFKISSAAKTATSVVAATLFLTACFGGGAVRPKPAELTAVTAQVAAPQVWTARIGTVSFPLQVQASGTTLALASDDGAVAMLDARSGRDIWRMSVATPISAGVGSDGQTAAVVSRSNDVIALKDGKELWRQKLQAQAFTAPFVAGGRVFVLAADRSVNAFDAATGRKLWTQQRPSEPLVLRQPGVMLAVGDTLVAGLAGRLAGLNPVNGTVRWEAPIASPRGINDVERLVDLVGTASRQGDTVCARAFQASVGCVNAERGALLWTKVANGAQGLGGDDQRIYGVEADGVVNALRRTDGERAWSTDRLRFRTLTTPVVAGRSVVIGDSTGLLHLLSREDGAVLNRLSTDGSAIAATPIFAGSTLVAVTRNGAVYGFQPQ